MKMNPFTALVALSLTTAQTQMANAQADERRYASVRGWTVTAFFENQSFAGCAGVNPDNGAGMRIAMTRDNSWGVSLRANGSGFTNGNLEIDGRNQSVQYQYSPDGWANVGLTSQELVNIRRGNMIGIDIGRGYFDFSLGGSSAAMGKITECVNNQGHKPQRQVAQSTPRSQPRASNQAPTQQMPTRAPAPQTPTQAPSQQMPINGACPQGEQFLPISGLCTGEASRMLVVANGNSDLDPQYMGPGCSVAVSETDWFGDVLLYEAERCNGVTAAYNSERGPNRTISGVLTGLSPSVQAYSLTTIGGSDDAVTNIEYRARDLMEFGDKNSCQAHWGDSFGYPWESIVFNDMNGNQTQTLCENSYPGEPCGHAACGPLGYFGDAKGYWRVFGNTAWFFDFGQDMSQIEARTMTLITRDAHGGWRVGSQFD